MLAEFVVDSRTCSEGFFPGSPVVLPPQKQHSVSISNSTLINPNSTRLNLPRVSLALPSLNIVAYLKFGHSFRKMSNIFLLRDAKIKEGFILP